ncbi:AraC family transcriptional regulator [Azospirillum sp. ST 5-10]|uniref:AraC family transcriptional regulator n=1 Tax=unclassified Azospirillum TaxID=2630922 RepID=UPI003F4A67CC
MTHGRRPALERSCDWVRPAPSRPGMERIEARFAGRAFAPHRHDTYAIGITLGGVQTFDYRGARCDSPAGHAVVLHPDEVHDGRAGSEAGFRYRILYLEPRLVQEALGHRTPLPFVRPAVSADPRLLRALHAALDDLDRMPEELEGDGAVLAVAEALAALDPTVARRPLGAAAAGAVARARAFLDEPPDRTVTSADLEAVSGLGRFALARHFRAVLGTSPYRYLTLRRLDRARALIGGGVPLAEAAADAGFADQSHMTRLFTRTYGVPPGRWRALLTR